MTLQASRNVVLSLLAMSACAQKPNITSTGSAPAASSTIVQDVQNAAVTACSFLPNSRSIEDLVATISAQMMQASQLADQICTALKTTPEPRGAVAGPVTVEVSNVPITGQRVR